MAIGWEGDKTPNEEGLCVCVCGLCVDEEEASE